MNDFDRLKKLIGREFDPEEVICEMIDEGEGILVNKSDNVGYDYIAYYNYEDSIQYLFEVDESNKIIDVREFDNRDFDEVPKKGRSNNGKIF